MIRETRPERVVVLARENRRRNQYGDLTAAHRGQVRGAQRVVIPGAAHHLNVEQPDEFNRIVLEFMDSLAHGLA